MLVLASDLVGAKALEILLSRRAPIRYVVLHRRDPGQFNAKIQELHAKHLSSAGVKLLFNDSLDDRTLASMAENRPELGFLAWWPEIIRDPLLTLPRRGWINFHPSYLPFNRGKY